MSCHPPHADSIRELHELRERVHDRGDNCLSLLLAGIEVYVSIGREWDLLEVMREFAHLAEEMVRNTPSAADLRELYEREDEGPPASG